MSTIIAVYRGDTVADARLIAVSADPALVADVSARLLSIPAEDGGQDAVIRSLEAGRRRALRLVQREAIDGR